SWSWKAFVDRSQGERDAWFLMFEDTGAASFALASLRQGLMDVFANVGTNTTLIARATAQRAHLFTVGRRRANGAEKLFAAGAGTTAGPATMAYEGAVTADDVHAARTLP